MLFDTQKKESSRSAWYRRGINLWPCIWCSGGKITFVSSDFQELHVRLKLGIRTRNRVGTVYGGSIYSSVDPYFMLMFMEILGRDYVVWDKGASVKFIRPITEPVRCRFLITDELIESVKAAARVSAAIANGKTKNLGLTEKAGKQLMGELPVSARSSLAVEGVASRKDGATLFMVSPNAPSVLVLVQLDRGGSLRGVSVVDLTKETGVGA